MQFDLSAEDSWGTGKRYRILRAAGNYRRCRAPAAVRHAQRLCIAAAKAVDQDSIAQELPFLSKVNSDGNRDGLRHERSSYVSSCDSDRRPPISNEKHSNTGREHASERASKEKKKVKQDGVIPRTEIPRPSLCVPEYELGSAPEAAFSSDELVKHRNRRRATILRVETLDPDGHPGLFRNFQSFFPPNSGYDSTLRVPESDKSIPRLRANPSCLSRNNRKRNLRPGDKRRRSALENMEHEPYNGLVSDGCQSSLIDLEYWRTTQSDSFPNSDSCDDGLIREGKRESHENNVILRRRKALTADDPICAPTEDMFSVLFSQAKSNPEMVLEGKLANECTGKVVRTSSEEHAETGNDAKTTNRYQSASDQQYVMKSAKFCEEQSSRYESEIAKALHFVGEKRRSSTDFDHRLESERQSKRRKNDSLQPSHFEDHTRRFGSHMLRKMGFRGRLGAHEQGAAEPLEISAVSGRAGLGGARKILNEGCDLLRNELSATNGIHIQQAPAVSSGIQEGRMDNNVPPDERQQRQIEYVSHCDVSVDELDGFRSNDPSCSEIERNDFERLQIRFTPGLSGRKKMAQQNESRVNSGEKRGLDDLDNGRRAILFEFDVFIKDAWKRRVRAFSDALSSMDGIPDDFNAANALIFHGRELGDEEAVRRLLLTYSNFRHRASLAEVMDRLDKCYSCVTESMVDHVLLRSVRDASQILHIGLMHCGSTARARKECEDLGLSHSFACSRTMGLRRKDASPYTSSWKELLCRIGVPACQSMIVASDHGKCVLPSAVIVARDLGTRVAVCVDTGMDVDCGSLVKPISDQIAQLKYASDVDFIALDSKFSKQLNFFEFVEDVAPKRRMEPVLAYYATDGLWYAARAVSGLGSDLNQGESVLIGYFHCQIWEWTRAENIEPISDCDLRILERSGYPGLLEPTDVTELA